MSFEIRKILELPDGFSQLEALAAAEGFNFLTKMKSAWLNQRNRFDQKGELLVAAFSEDGLIGICGRNIDPYTEERHVGRVRHLYVLPKYRGKGVGCALVKTVLDGADSYFKVIRLRTKDKEAARFYENLGFNCSSEQFETHVLTL